MPCRFWRFFYLDPGSPLPLLNLRLVSLLGPETWALQSPSHLPQHSPHMPGVIVHRGHRLDQLRHPWQCPQVRRVALSSCPLKEFRTDLLNLILVQPPPAACSGGALNRCAISIEPIVVPTTNALTAYAERCGNSSLAFSFTEQSGGLLPSLPEPLKPFDSPLHKARIQRENYSFHYIMRDSISTKASA